MEINSQHLELTRFISISLDVAESTSAKDKLVTFASKWKLNLPDLYEQFAHGLLNTERQFLDLLCAIKANPHGKCAYELERLFLIKTIGDEWWYSYSLEGLDRFEVSQHARHLFMALLAVLSKTPVTVSIPCAPELHPDGLDEFEDILFLELPLKITCDLICGFDIGRGRESAISPVIASCSGKQLVRVGDELFQRMMSNLGAIQMIPNYSSGKVTSICRSDFVGMEVDRFFRLTAKAMKGRVLVGAQLFEALELEEYPVEDAVLDEGWKSFVLREKFQGGNYTTLSTHIFIHFKSENGYELKGIAGLYQAAICTDRHSQSGNLVWKGKPIIV